MRQFHRISLAHARRVFEDSRTAHAAERTLGLPCGWMKRNGLRKYEGHRARSFHPAILHAHGFTLEMIEAATGLPPKAAVAAIQAGAVR